MPSLPTSGAARADDYPNHSVRWLVGYPPGGSTDICARLIGQYLSEHLGQQFAIENKAGAGNNLATELAAHSPPDGYTVFLVNPANTINASLYKNLSFNFIRDMAPVAGFIRVPNVMEVNPAVPAKTVAEFIAYAKANPGKVNMASSGRRHLGASVGRIVHDDDRRRPRARAVSRRGPGVDRPVGRPGAGDVRQSAIVDRSYSGRQAAGAGGDDGDARQGVAGCADRCRDGAGL